MEHNPYTAPQTRLDTPAEAPPAPRPIAVWILSILLILFALLAVVGFAGFVFAWMIGPHPEAVGGIGPLMIALLWRAVFITLFFAVAYGAFRRQRWARWVGVLLIVGMAILAIFRQDTTLYLTDAERAGGYIGRYVIFPLLLAWWAYAFAFSAKARRYFSKQSSDAG